MHHKFALIPRPLLPEREKGSRIGSPSPVLGEGFRVRANAFTTVAGLIFASNLLNHLKETSSKIRKYGKIKKPSSLVDLFKNNKNRQVNLSPAYEGWILDILNP
jgi:hypothetical protein